MAENKSDALTLDDLEISDVDVSALMREESVGVPELGASLSYYGCSTQNCGKKGG
jgi:hypothetical protein